MLKQPILALRRNQYNPMLASLTKLYRWISLLSIDIAVGAGVSSIFFARLFDVHLRVFPIIILVLTVWMIYAADHLLDVSNADVKTLSTRRQFHFLHQRSMIISIVVCLVAVCILTFFLYLKVVVGGLVLMIFSCSYFVLKNRIKGLKEIFSGMIYCCGILLAPTLNRVGSLSSYHFETIGAFGLTVLLNLVLFAYYDHSHDIREKHVSLATLIGIQNTKHLIELLFFIQMILLSVLLSHAVELYSVMTIILMNLVLMTLFFYKESFEKNNNFRLIGDAIFLFPVLYLAFN